jgi:hypothetical protein
MAAKVLIMPPDLDQTFSGTPVLDLTKIGALAPDVEDRQEQGWTEREDDG